MQTDAHPRITRCDVTPDGSGAYNVEPVWAADVPLDRPCTGGWLIRDTRLVDRLRRAVEAGAAHEAPAVRVDVDGRTYVAARSLILGRTANADLARLGF